jgi:aspartyl-tRNA(Asn)/glutamyl-tRNA(Gln) amidotransferase subunit B
MRYLEVSSGDMEKGVIRFEANVSIRPSGSEEMGTRTEIKNLNSFRAMERALTYEIDRQSQVLEDGGTVSQETVGWDESRGMTVSQRSKEEAHDYRYFPEPDLPPLVLDKSWIDEIRTSLPELAHSKQERFIHDMELTPYSASVLTADKLVADYFESAVSAGPELPAMKLANWITSDLFGLLNENNVSIEEVKIKPDDLVELVRLVENGTINLSSGRSVLLEMFATGLPASTLVEQGGLARITDLTIINDFVKKVVKQNPEQLHQYQEGKISILEWFFGQAMRAMNGRAAPEILRNALESHLHELEKHHRQG